MSVTQIQNFIERVRQETRPLHDDLEEVLGLERIVASREEYVRILRRFYGVWKPLEDLLQKGPLRNDTAIQLSERMRADRIVGDLQDLGEDTETLALAPVPFSQLNRAESAGILYVLEGSTLGGALISKRLREDLGIDPVEGGSFFAGHGEQNGAMWKDFRDWASREITDKKEIDDAVAAAVAAFGCFVDWFQPIVAE